MQAKVKFENNFQTKKEKVSIRTIIECKSSIKIKTKERTMINVNVNPINNHFNWHNPFIPGNADRLSP